MKKYVFVIVSIMFGLMIITCEAKSSSSSSSYSSSRSSSSFSSSKSYSFSSSPSKSYGSSSSSKSSSSFFGSSSETSKPKSYLSYESKKNDSLIQKGDSGATYRRMDKQMADAGIKKKESVTQIERAFSSPPPKPPVVPSVTGGVGSINNNVNRGYAYTNPTPRTQVIERHHYHSDNSGSEFVNGMIVGSMLNHQPRETVVINNGGSTTNSVTSTTKVQHCTVYDNDCITEKFHFIKSVDF